MNQTAPRTNTNAPPRPDPNRPTPAPPPRPTEPPPHAPVKAEEPPPAKPASPYRVTYHVVTPTGFPMDIQRDISGSELIAWVAAQDDAMLKAGFKPRESDVKVELPTLASGGQNSGQAPADDDAWIPKFCPDCGAQSSTFWDNRSDPHRPPGGPDLKCRNPDCEKGFWKDPPRNRGTSRGRR